jgi:two-component system, response regulator YesN
MEQVASRVNLSPFYFSKLFKMHVGETFIDYLTNVLCSRSSGGFDQGVMCACQGKDGIMYNNLA